MVNLIREAASIQLAKVCLSPSLPPPSPIFSYIRLVNSSCTQNLCSHLYLSCKDHDETSYFMLSMSLIMATYVPLKQRENNPQTPLFLCWSLRYGSAETISFNLTLQFSIASAPCYCNHKYTWCFHKAKLVLYSPCKHTKNLCYVYPIMW